MKRCAVLIMVLAVSIWAGAQTSQTGTSSATQPTVVAPGMVAGPNGLSTNTGTAVIIAPPSAPLLVTPEISLTSPAPATAGASSATPGNMVGATNAVVPLPIQPRLQANGGPQYGTGAPAMETVSPQPNAAGVVAGSTQAETTGGQAGSLLIVNGRAAFDRGVGSGAVVGAFDNTGGRSLGEIAREMRQKDATANARTYTNQDIERINQQPGVTVGGMSGAAVGAGNAAQQPPSSNNMPVVSQPANPQPANPQPPNQGVSQPVPQNPPQSQINQPATGEQRREMAQANPPANPAERTAPADNNTEQAPANTRGARQLPAGGSILPVMALVGFLAAGAGLLAR